MLDCVRLKVKFASIAAYITKHWHGPLNFRFSNARIISLKEKNGSQVSTQHCLRLPIICMNAVGPQCEMGSITVTASMQLKKKDLTSIGIWPVKIARIYLIILSMPIKLNKIVFVCHEFSFLKPKSTLCYLHKLTVVLYPSLPSTNVFGSFAQRLLYCANNVFSVNRRHIYGIQWTYSLCKHYHLYYVHLNPCFGLLLCPKNKQTVVRLYKRRGRGQI